MKRRDLLKILGVGGVLPFIKTEKAEAAPPPVVQAPQTKLYTMGSATFNSPPLSALSGTVCFFQPLAGMSAEELNRRLYFDLDGDE